MLFKCATRPSIAEQAVLGICQAAIENLNPRNTVLIFTHCDQDDEFNEEYGVEWYNDGMLENTGLPEITPDRIFCFRGKNGQGGAATTHEELSAWVTSKLPRTEADKARIKNIDYADYCHNMADSGNEAMNDAVKAELAMLKGLLHE